MGAEPRRLLGAVLKFLILPAVCGNRKKKWPGTPTAQAK